MTDKNTCDKCKESVHTLDLIWITSEDFTPLPDESINWEKAKNLDAVCGNCYGDIIELKGAKNAAKQN